MTWWHAVLSFSICGCVCVCPFLGQVSLKTSPKHRAQGKHFPVKSRNPPVFSLAEFVWTQRGTHSVVSGLTDVFPSLFIRSKQCSALSLISLLSSGDLPSESLLSPLIPAWKIAARMSWATEVISAFTELTICCLKCHRCYCKTAGVSG